MQGILCSRCGAQNAADDTFCSKCGATLAAPSQSSTPPSAMQQPAIAQYQPMMYRPFFTLGMGLVIIGGILVLVGFLVDLIGTAALSANSTFASVQAYEEGFDALVGIGLFVAILGWVFHQMSTHNRRQ